ncbi:hypothetical protein SAMN02745823_02674 [Sporobacter termitidis DSM 10068]|uniref:Uncharacterized protein n=1 Tax=Sporobacter termitidis DSM 10068 TaxID=1123282 RepID=A0A1M5YMF2_9FIRM|nr:hypothetical protein [Sporobacter termitidis]SHI13277.1 hypothetical protein SAMN02745823_02674 [Sporobacter termitidis DSM 10068]
MPILCTMVYISFALIDLIPIVRNKRWKVLAVYAVLILASYTFSMLTEQGIQLPSPAGPLKDLVTSIVGIPKTS